MSERIDDLQRNGLKIIQKKDSFCFGMDAVLLADFVRLRPNEQVADLGTGTGVLPLLLSQNEPSATFAAFEWQPDMADLAQRNVLLNQLSNRIHIIPADYRKATDYVAQESMDTVVCNPPYGKHGTVLPSTKPTEHLARHETDCSLAETIQSCATLVRNRGRVFVVFPAARALELWDVMRAVRLEPKRVRMVQTLPDRAPYLVLTEAIKNARPSLHWMPTLLVRDGQHRETDEIGRIYHADPSAMQLDSIQE